MGDLQQHNLQSFIQDYNCKQFVETGTGKGTGLSYACSFPFESLYSIEIVPELYEHCVQVFKSDERVSLIHDNSLDGLRTILSSLSDDPTFFWLDAHFPGADFHFNDYDHMKDEKHLHMPLVDEIKLIHSSRPNCADVYIIDDLHLYEDGPFEIHMPEFIEKYGNKDITPATDLLKDTHVFIRDRRHQGFLIFIPKV